VGDNIAILIKLLFLLFTQSLELFWQALYLNSCVVVRDWGQSGFRHNSEQQPMRPIKTTNQSQSKQQTSLMKQDALLYTVDKWKEKE